MSFARGSLRYGDDTIPYSVRVRDRRPHRIAIHVEPGGQVLVDAPRDASGQAIQVAVRKRARWIWKHWQASRRRLEHIAPREYVSGETHFYLGRRYRLKVIEQTDARGEVTLHRGVLEVRTADKRPVVVREALAKWYRLRAKEVFAERLEALRAELRWPRTAPVMRLRFMSSRWGSCSATGTLTLNPYLVRAARRHIDYVLLHELCHLKVKGHGAAFHRLLDRHMPDWRQAKKQLDDLAERFLAF